MSNSNKNKSSLQGKIMIRKGNENQKPCVVYVSHFNTNIELWITRVINTGDTYMSSESTLIDFDYYLFERMEYEWELEQLPKTKKRIQNLLKEIKLKDTNLKP